MPKVAQNGSLMLNLRSSWWKGYLRQLLVKNYVFEVVPRKKIVFKRKTFFATADTIGFWPIVRINEPIR